MKGKKLKPRYAGSRGAQAELPAYSERIGDPTFQGQLRRPTDFTGGIEAGADGSIVSTQRYDCGGGKVTE